MKDKKKTKFKPIFQSVKGTGTIHVLGRDIHYTYRELQTIQMKLILLFVWAERAVLCCAKTALKFKYEIQIG